MKGTWLGGRTEAFCFSFIYPSAGREKRIRNILGRIKSTGEKNIPRKRKSKSMEMLNAGETLKRGGTDRQYVNNVYENPEKIFSGREI